VRFYQTSNDEPSPNCNCSNAWEPNYAGKFQKMEKKDVLDFLLKNAFLAKITVFSNFC